MQAIKDLLGMLESVARFHSGLESDYALAGIAGMVREMYDSAPLSVSVTKDGKLEISAGSSRGVIVTPLGSGGFHVSCWSDGPLMDAGDWSTVRDAAVACVVALRVS